VDTDAGTAATPVASYARTPVPHAAVNLPMTDSSASSPLVASGSAYAFAATRRKNSTATDPGLGHMRGRQPISEPGTGRRASLTARGPPTSVLAQQHQRRQHDRSHSHSQHASGVQDTSSPVSPPDPQQNIGVLSASATLARGISLPIMPQADMDDLPKPEEFEPLLDGTRNSDELCIRFGVSWRTVEKWCDTAEGGKVYILCR
jgi:hypothetical protein